MEVSNSKQLNGAIQRGSQAQAARGLLSGVSERMAQVYAALITVGAIGLLGYGLNSLFISLGFGA